MSERCRHLEALSKAAVIKTAVAFECVDCLKMKDEGSKEPTWWVHLRTCQTDGKTRCCDSSPNKHASKHAAAHTVVNEEQHRRLHEQDVGDENHFHHQVVVSAEPHDNWAYCYVDEEFISGSRYNAYPGLEVARKARRG